MTDEQLDAIERYGKARLRVGDAATAQILLLVKAVREARVEMDDFAIAVGYGERPEGQSGVHRLHCEQLADRWKQIERERDEARALLAALKEAHRPTDEIRAQLLAEIEAHAETKAEVERLKAALRLLWEEAQDKAAIRDATCDLVEAALAEAAP